MSIATLQDKELQQHYDEMFALFTSPGWKRFQEQVDTYIQQVESVRNVAPKTVDFRLGQIDVLDWFLNAKAQHESAYAMLIAEEYPEEFDDPSV